MTGTRAGSDEGTGPVIGIASAFTSDGTPQTPNSGSTLDERSVAGEQAICVARFAVAAQAAAFTMTQASTNCVLGVELAVA